MDLSAQADSRANTSFGSIPARRRWFGRASLWRSAFPSWRAGSSATVGVRTAVLLLLASLIWAFSATASSAQNIPPLQPCTPGTDARAPGWNKIWTPDCSTTRGWGATEERPWLDGEVPALPSGDTTFRTLAYVESFGSVYREGMSTTITGLIPGRVYTFDVLVNQNRGASYLLACAAVDVTVDSVEYIASGLGNIWRRVPITFTASGFNASLSCWYSRSDRTA